MQMENPIDQNLAWGETEERLFSVQLSAARIADPFGWSKICAAPVFAGGFKIECPQPWQLHMETEHRSTTISFATRRARIGRA